MKSLNFGRNQINDVELERLEKLTQLKRLSIQGRFTDDGIKSVGKLPNLQHLSISSPKVMGQFLEGDGLFPKIEGLILDCDKVGDAIVPHIIKRSTLRSLSFYGTKMTTDGIERIKKGLPSCKVYDGD